LKFVLIAILKGLATLPRGASVLVDVLVDTRLVVLDRLGRDAQM